MMSRIALFGAAVLLLGAAGGEAIAQAYPSKAVRLISPYPPGGGTLQRPATIGQSWPSARRGGGI